MIPARYLPIDNNLQLSINQSRNDGSLSYSVSLQIDTNKHEQGINLIDSMILNELSQASLFEVDPYAPMP
jgi:hypothetical protein